MWKKTVNNPMFPEFITPKLKDIGELIIDNEVITHGKLYTLKINAGKLASGNRINVLHMYYILAFPNRHCWCLGVSMVMRSMVLK
ncbi:MAG: hypothetical protein IPJ13_27645 [Saprospiraceae bacterium]|nr:hypothetical protein [Saprospiraceae bacterium]